MRGDKIRLARINPNAFKKSPGKSGPFPMNVSECDAVRSKPPMTNRNFSQPDDDKSQLLATRRHLYFWGL
jgi:hypothetical protein